MVSMEKKVKGYTAQARFYAQHLEQPETGDWLHLGWTRINDRETKGVFRASDGTAVYILPDPLDHLMVHIRECQTPIVATEEELWPAVAGPNAGPK